MDKVVSFNHDCVILDACSIINLYATNRFSDILSALPVEAIVSSYVKERETLSVVTGLQSDGTLVKQPIDLTSFINSQLISIVSPDNTLLANDLIFFASKGLHNGEAISAAIALNNNWAIATDEVRVIRVFAREAPNIQAVSTYDFVQFWAKTRNIPTSVLREVVYRIRVYGRFMPAKSHPHYDWIVKLMTS